MYKIYVLLNQLTRVHTEYSMAEAANFWTDYEKSSIVQWIRKLITGKHIFLLIVINDTTAITGKGGPPELGFTMQKTVMFERVRAITHVKYIFQH